MSQTEHKNISKIVSISIAVLALILLLLYMQGSFVSKVAPGLSPQSSDSNTPISNSALVELKQVGDILTWPGTVRSRTVANIAPRMTARILEIKVNAGDKVKKGDVIARLDEREVRAQENAALAALAGANAQANRAKADEQRTRGLYSKEAATREKFDAVVAQADPHRVARPFDPREVLALDRDRQLKAVRHLRPVRWIHALALGLADLCHSLRHVAR